MTNASARTATLLAGATALAVVLVGVARLVRGAGDLPTFAPPRPAARPAALRASLRLPGEAERHRPAEDPGRFARALPPLRVRFRTGDGAETVESSGWRGPDALLLEGDPERGTLWLGRNPRDPERLRGEWLPPGKDVVVELTESDLVRELGSGRWSGHAGFGVTPHELEAMVPTGETEEAFGVVFGRWVRLDEVPPGALEEAWWNDELALPLRWTRRLGDGRRVGRELVALERPADAGGPPLLHALNPALPRMDLADLLEEE